MEFKKPTPKDYQTYKKWLFSAENSCEYSYLNACMWQDVWKYEYAIFEGSLIIRLDVDGEKIYNLPLLGDMSAALSEIEKTESGYPVFSSGEGKALDAFMEKHGNEFACFPIEENNEYIYSREELALLAGKKFHQKRNHISAFTRKYNWRFERLTSQNVPDVLRVAEKWLLERDPQDEELVEEFNSIKNALNYIDELEIIGGILYVDSAPVAFCFGSAINDKVFDVNIEKALSDFQGAYAVINNEFVKNCLSDFEFVNREDDLGIEGLRKAKLSYRPVKILKKYLIKKK